MARKPRSIIDLFSSEQPYVTEFRRLLHRLRKPENGTDLKSVMVTSAMLSEGKSTVSTFLALTAARQKGMKTLLIDADLRRPSIHKFFSLERSRGLAEVIMNGLAPADAVKKTSQETLNIITAGRSPSHPSEVFNAELIGKIIDEMKFYYDFILVDCPPVLPVSDPMLLASKVDGILMVVKAGVTQREVVERAIGILDPGRSRILGVILNNMNSSLPYYYDYSYYGYQYEPEKEPRKKSAASRRRRKGELRTTKNGSGSSVEQS